MNRDDVGMIERRGGLRFFQKAALGREVVVRAGRQDLERDGTPEFRLFGLKDFAHSAATDFLDNAVVEKLLLAFG